MKTFFHKFESLMTVDTSVYNMLTKHNFLWLLKTKKVVEVRLFINSCIGMGGEGNG